jgi:hypothetical protein
MLSVLVIIIGYSLGFIISLVVIHKFKDRLSVNNYDPPHPTWYDDYSSNAQAYVWFSIAWPLFWIIKGCDLTIDQLVSFSKWIENNLSKK